MVILVAMDLRTYLEAESISPAAFAPRIGVSVQALYRYMARHRLPRRQVMARISDATRGAVTANDFFAPVDALPATAPHSAEVA